MKRFVLCLGVLAFVFCVGQVNAALITYNILSHQPSGTAPTTTVYSGSGYAGQHSTSFSPYFMAEEQVGGGTWSTTMLQQDISALHIAATINSATLDYVLLSGTSGTVTIRLTSFTTTGTFGFSFLDAPDNLGQVFRTSIGISSNSVDVTSLLADRVNAGADWFGLHIRMTTPGQYHWTGLLGDADRAQVRLNVDYEPIPEPATILLIGSGLVGLASYGKLRLRRKKKT